MGFHSDFDKSAACDALIVKANAKIKRRQYADALALFDECVERCPDLSAGYIGRIKVFNKQKKWNECLEASDDCLSRRPGLAAALKFKGRALVGLGRFDEARELYQSAFKTHPHNLGWPLGLARLHFRQKRWDQCIRECEKGLNLAPEHVGLLNLKVNSLINLGQFEEARLEYVNISKPQSGAEPAQRGKALFYFKMNRWRKCVDACSAILRINPDLPQIINLKMESLIKLGEHEEANIFMTDNFRYFWDAPPKWISRKALKESTSFQRNALRLYRTTKVACGEYSEAVEIEYILNEFEQVVDALPRIYGQFADAIAFFDNSILELPDGRKHPLPAK